MCPMTIDEAIEHSKHVAETCGDAECALEHRQLAEWLSNYDAMSSRAAMYRYLYLRWRDDCETLKAENERLKRKLEILKAHGVEIVDAVADGFEIYNDEHARANTLAHKSNKLKKLVREMWACYGYL